MEEAMIYFIAVWLTTYFIVACIGIYVDSLERAVWRDLRIAYEVRRG